MIRLDKVDNNIIGLLKENKDMNLSQLWLRSLSREGQKCFKERVLRLEKLDIIYINTNKWKGGIRYLMGLKVKEVYLS